MNTRFQNLYRQYIKKGVSPSDFTSFKESLSQTSDDELWNAMTNEWEEDAVETEGMPTLMKEQIRKNLHRLIWRHRLTIFAKYAAIIVLLITSSWGVFSLIHTTNAPQAITAHAKSGNKSEIVLPDGTQIQLNSETTLTYNINTGKERLAHLSGEAFFNVTKNPKRPFKVIANGLQIEVLGTSFNVNTHKKDITETSLVTGRIRISGKSLPHTYILHPGEKATYYEKDKSLKITKADMHVETEWKDDYLIFDSEPLVEVIKKIERWYGVEIDLQNQQIGQDLLSGSFRHESIQNVIQSLSLQYKFKYEIHKNKITIY